MATLPARRSEQRAEQLVQREYEELRAPTLRAVRSRLAAQGIRFDDADLDEFYNQAWHGLYEQLVRGEEVENRGGFLVVAAHRRAIEEVRRVQPDRRADAVDAGETAQDLDLTQRLDDRRRLLGAMEGMRERFSTRERQAAALCYLHGYSRPEAAAALGVAPKRMEKLMDGVSTKLGALTTEIDEGDWCESRQSLMKAYAYGVLDPEGERYAIARAHLEECPACRKYVRGLRGIAAVVPPVWPAARGC
jgi:DNA-directed RNA polymerase specialized sigma24 family protein